MRWAMRVSRGLLVLLGACGVDGSGQPEMSAALDGSLTLDATMAPLTDAPAPTDGPPPDLATSGLPAPDLTNIEFGAPDLAMPDLAMPDLLTADLLMPWSFSETFPLADNSPWPARWKVLGGVASSTVQTGRGRIVPRTSNYSLGRLGVADGARDLEVSFTVRFEDVGSQGVGFYVRQNGGWLQGTNPPGQGYAAFLEGFRGPRLGVWREQGGVETEIAFAAVNPPLQSNATYAVRLRVTQAGPMSTRLQARVWVSGAPEPNAWLVDAMDATPVLQNLVGGMAIDSWSTAQVGNLAVGTQVDDIAAVGL